MTLIHVIHLPSHLTIHLSRAVNQLGNVEVHSQLDALFEHQPIHQSTHLAMFEVYSQLNASQAVSREALLCAFLQYSLLLVSISDTRQNVARELLQLLNDLRVLRLQIIHNFIISIYNNNNNGLFATGAKSKLNMHAKNINFLCNTYQIFYTQYSIHKIQMFTVCLYNKQQTVP
jgi:hypothetical protein